jgi:hypothetical protein
MTRTFLPLGLSLAAAILVAQPAARGDVTVTSIGTPVFELVDTHLYAAPTDSFPSLFPNHFPTRIIHAPPYDQEFADGLALAGYPDKEVFSVEEFTSPSAVHFGYVLVPNGNAPTGSSFDYVSGPIIPNDIFPIAAAGDVYRNGAVFEQNAFNLSLTSAAGFDGRSHFIVEHWENSDFAPPGLDSLVGDYEYRLALRDVNNNGFDVVAHFQVVPEPITLSPFALGAIVLAGCAWRRRKQASR